MRTNNIWSAGDFSKIAPAAMIVGEVLCDAVPLYAGQRVLDLGCGTGNTALAAARRRAQVWGADPVPALLELARGRAAFEGLEIGFDLGGAEALPYKDGAFDVVLSSFGLVFCEEQAKAIGEVARVLGPAGKLGFTSWAEGGVTDLLFAKCIERRPDLASIVVERGWGRLEQIAPWLRPQFGSLRIEHRKFTVRALSVEQWLSGMKLFLSPVVLAYEGLSEAEAADLDSELMALGAEHNEAPEHGYFARVPYFEVHCEKLAAKS